MQRSAGPTLNIYPNPAKSSFQVSLPGAAAGAQVVARLCNAVGQLMGKQLITLPSNAQLTVAGLPKGSYFVQIPTNQLLRCYPAPVE